MTSDKMAFAPYWGFRHFMMFRESKSSELYPQITIFASGAGWGEEGIHSRRDCSRGKDCPVFCKLAPYRT